MSEPEDINPLEIDGQGRTPAIAVADFFLDAGRLTDKNRAMSDLAISITKALEDAGVKAEIRWLNICDDNGPAFEDGFFFVRGTKHHE